MSISKTPYFHLDASVLSGLADGDSIATWMSLVGALYVTQSDPTRQPIYKTNIINGLPVVRFDGLAQTLIAAATSDWTFLNDGTGASVFLAFRLNGDITGKNQSIIDTGASDPYGGGLFSILSMARGSRMVRPYVIPSEDTLQIGINDPQAHTDALLNISGGPHGDVWSIADSRYHYGDPVADLVGSINGIAGAAASQVPSTDAPARPLTIASLDQTYYFSGMDLAELIIYKDVLTDQEHATVRADLASKWGITF